MSHSQRPKKDVLHRILNTSLLRILLFLAAAGVPVFLLLLWQSARIEMTARAAVNAADASSTQAVPAGEVSGEELRKAVDAAVDAAIKRDELLLDKMLLLVGGYSAILTFLALATAFVSWRESKEQLESVRADTEALTGHVRTELDTTRKTAGADIEGLKREVTREFPIISRMQNRVLDLILRLEAKYPEDEDVNEPRTETWEIEEKHQDILIDEAQILAISVVVLDDANLVRLYLLLSKAYFEQFRTGDLTLGDAARAYLYANRAIDCDRSSADAYRMRGFISLSRFNMASEEEQKTREYQELLQQAKTDFLRCKSLDPVNAGALYNLALIGSYEGSPDEALHVSEELLAVRASIPRKAKEKYLPDVYINAACFLADKAKAAMDPAAQREIYARIVAVCEEGKEYLSAEVKSSKAMKNFSTSLMRELGTGGDFSALPADTRALLRDLL